jgi:hypothetical protein
MIEKITFKIESNGTAGYIISGTTSCSEIIINECAMRMNSE